MAPKSYPAAGGRWTRGTRASVLGFLSRSGPFQMVRMFGVGGRQGRDSGREAGAVQEGPGGLLGLAPFTASSRLHFMTGMTET